MRARRPSQLLAGGLAAALLGTAAPALAQSPAFSATVTRVTAADLPHSWRKGCPVGPAQLRAIHLNHWGFDGRTHNGVLIVNADVTSATITIFRRLFATRFPVRGIRSVDDFGGSDASSMQADNTSGFNCRYAVAPGKPSWSAHAYGRAIDVNPVENPYLEGGQVRPPNGKPYRDRSRHRPGMAYRGGTLVSAFAAQNWPWGGRWTSSPDYQHFSADGT